MSAYGARGAYWLTPPRRRIIAWARHRWPEGHFTGWPLARLRALWHRMNAARENFTAKN